MVQRVDGRPVIRHTGGMVSFSSAFAVDLESGFGAFASINAQQEYRPTPVALWSTQVLRAASKAEAAPKAPAVVPATTIEKVSDYAGTYHGATGRQLEFVAEGDHLYLLHGGARVPVETLSVPGLLARHPGFERFVLTFTRANGSDGGPFTDVAHGDACYTRNETQEPTQAAVPASWRTFVGHYRNNDPWFGSFRIVIRRDRLWALYGGGYEFPLEPMTDRTFRLADVPNSADWVRFMDEVNGQASHLNLSGELYWRVEAP
jgi:hypothetical protein